MINPLLAHLLDSAGRAPSAHNTQPWVLRPAVDKLEVRIQPGRTLPACDPAGVDTLHALGAMLENLILTLAHLGFAADYEVAQEAVPGAPTLVLRWRAREAPQPDPRLYRMIPIRRTSRLPFEPAPISTEVLDALQTEVGEPCRLTILTGADDLLYVRRLVVEASIAQLADDRVSTELYHWLRFSHRDERWFRDGLNAACMNWGRPEAMALSCSLSPRILRVLTRLGLHRALGAGIDIQAPPAPALCLVTVRSQGTASRIEAGRCLQRVWLAAASAGLATHPLSAAVDDTTTRPRVLKRFNVEDDWRHVNLFRLGRSAPSARSPRLPADEILDRAGF